MSSGRWQRPAHGVVVLHSGPLTPDEAVQVELFAHGRHAVLGGVSAARADGLRIAEPPGLHIVVPHGSRDLARPGVVLHRSRTLAESQIHPVRTPRRTRLPRSVIDAAAWAGTDLGAQAVIASAVQQRLVTPNDLAGVVGLLARIRRRALITETIRDVSGGSLSEYEVLFIRLCRRYGLPLPTRQRRRKDAAGRWRYLDADYDDFDLVVEIDGQQHMEPRPWWEDMMRDNDLVANDGKWVMRFAGFALRRESDRVAAVLRAFFARHAR
ncbi:MAG: hypothetical protein ABI720_10600 [Actinomycetes bacterium]